MAIYPKAASELNIFNDDVGDAISPPDFFSLYQSFLVSTNQSMKFLHIVQRNENENRSFLQKWQSYDINNVLSEKL